MISHGQFEMQTLLRRQTGLVEITDATGCSRGTIEPSRALQLVVQHGFEGFGSRDEVHYLRLAPMAAQRDWTRPAEDSQTVYGRVTRKQFDQQRSAAYANHDA